MPKDEHGREKDHRVEWERVRTLRDVGEATARWLEGTITYHPTNNAPRPAAETRAIADALCRMNRLGFVTEWSQPGMPFDGSDGQRACVTGFCGEDVARALNDGLGPTDMIMLAREPRGTATGVMGVPVTWRDGAARTWAGTFWETHEFEGRFWNLPALGELLAFAWEVHLIDPVWGRADLLWAATLDVLEDRS